jgi:replicative DNA helicase Mcm
MMFVEKSKIESSRELVEEKLTSMLKREAILARLKRGIRMSGEETHMPFYIPYDDFVQHGVDTEWLDKRTEEVIEISKRILAAEVKKECTYRIPEIDFGIVDIPKYTIDAGMGKIRLGETRADHIGRYVAVEGIANNVAQPQPFLSKRAYLCRKCGEKTYQTRASTYVCYSPEPAPKSCDKQNCLGELVRSEVDDVYEDQRTFVLQELPSECGGREPRRMLAVLKCALVNKVQVLHQVEVMGVLRLSEKKLAEELFNYYIDVYAMSEKGFKYMEEPLTQEDVKMIEEVVAKDKRIVANMAKSLFPYMRINMLIKVGLLLQQIRGVRLDLPNVSVGDVIHCCWLSDPGCGKSAIGQYIAKACPGASYIMATAASKAGVTAAVLRDEFTKEWRLAIGAIPLSNGSVSVLDEVDKLMFSPTGKDTIAGIRQIMAQQNLKVDKAGISAWIPADVCLLFLFNPRGDSMLTDEKPAAQLPTVFDKSLLNRIDLFFVSYDRPEEVEDRKSAKHMLTLYRGLLDEEISEPPVYDAKTVRKYIQWAKNNSPLLSEQATRAIEDFYVDLRKLAKIEGAGMVVPIGIRQLETVVKLAGAFSKAHGYKEILPDNVQEALELFRGMLAMWGVVDKITGAYDFSVITGIAPKSVSDKMKIVIRYLTNADPECMGVPKEKIIEELTRFKVEDPEKIFEKMLQAGELLMRGLNKYTLSHA